MDIWRYKGGPRCKHYWTRRTYVSAEKKAKIGSRNTIETTTEDAAKFGYRVRNPKEVAMEPRDMRYKGYSPNNPNRPKDAR